MKLSELVNFQSNFTYLNEIKRNRENIIPFVGAGISKGCGLYTWGELLHKLATEYLTVEEIGALEKRGNFFDFADKIVSVSGNSDIIMKKIRTIFSESKVCLTELPFLIVSMFSPMIITTKYDTLLEDASANSPLGYLRPLLPCLVGQMNEAIQMNERRLLKLHGSIEETQSFVFTTEQYHKVYGNKGKRGNRFLPLFLKKIFSGKKVLFIGCSLEQDRTLEILEECVKQNHSITHYAILPYFSDSIKQIKRNSILSKYGIEPIFYPEGDFQAVNKLLIYLSEENHFIISIRSILDKLEDNVEIQILISILKECYYKTSIRFPGLLDIDNVKNDFTEDILKSIGTSRNQTDTVLSICREAFSAYVKLGFLYCQKETISYFNEQLTEEALKETEIEPLLQKKWSIPRNLTNIKDLNLSWITALDDNEINNFANELLEKLQYRNGMSFIDIGTSYNMAKSLIDYMEERIDFEIRIKLLNSIGAFGHFFQDSDAALTYLEEAIHAERASGTQMKKRSEFMKMLKTCKQGRIDLILTKSISRFGRNTLDTLKTLYELFNLGVKVYFEKENLNNYDKEMRTMMGIYAGFAQEESKNMSDNIKWGIRERMREGKVCLNCTRFLGYDKDENGKLVVVESEAVIVRKIFELYLNGWGVRKIKKYLEENEIKTVTGKDVWSTSTIDRILSNEKYVGDVLMQKSFTEDFLTGKRKKNEGELTMYFIENDHEAIVNREMFESVQKRKNK